MTVSRGRARVETMEAGASVSRLELFFDLVFVFAATQVTSLVADDLTAEGVVRGLLLLALLWWSWVGYAWLGNVVRVDEGLGKLVLLTAMGAMFVLALAVPEAFDDLPGGLPGPLVVVICYLAFRTLHLALFWIVSDDDPALRRQLVRFTPSLVVSGSLLLVAAAVDGTARTVLWALALAADYLGTWLGGASGWRLRSAEHFAERHALIIIVVLGESIVAIGVGVAELATSWAIVGAALLGLALVAGLWWLYFDVTALVVERALHDAADEEQAALARDAYSFLHLPLGAGVVLVAIGLKKVLEYVGDTVDHDLSDALDAFAVAGLLGGVALFLLGLVGVELRSLRTTNALRLGLALGLLATIPLATGLPALAALGLVVTAVVALAVVETVRSEDRLALHHEGHGHTADV